MTKQKIQLHKVYFSLFDGIEIEVLQEEIDRIEALKKEVKDCEGVHLDIDINDNCSSYHSWIFYRLETEEEYEQRKEKEEKQREVWKRQQYDRLKKELGL